MLVEYTDWMPDIAGLNSGVLQRAINVLPYEAGYLPMPSLSRLSNQLGETVYGAFLAITQDASKIKYVFVGTAGKLWRLSTSMGWTDVSQAATTYAATSADRWSFAQFGPYVIAVNPNDDPQVFDLSAPGSGTTFADLGGSPPRARIVSVWGDFLVLGCLSGGNPNRVQWSGINDIENWTPGTGNSDYQDLPDGGWVKGLPATDPPIILQDSSIRRATFLPGTSYVFSFEKIADGIGSTSFYSSVSRDRNVFFLGDDGFYVVSTDGLITPIGKGKINRTFLSSLDIEWSEATLAAVDPFNPRVYWVSRSIGASGSAYNRITIYDFSIGKFTELEMNVQHVVPLATPGFTLEELDTFGDLDSLAFSLDSRVWAGGIPTLGAIDDDGYFGFFAAADMEATLTTCEYGDPQGTVREIQTVLPMVDCNDIYVSIGYRFARGDNVQWTSEARTSSRTGIARCRKRARYHTVKVRVPANSGWSFAQGFDAGFIEAGAPGAA